MQQVEFARLSSSLVSDLLASQDAQASAAAACAQAPEATWRNALAEVEDEVQRAAAAAWARGAAMQQRWATDDDLGVGMVHSRLPGKPTQPPHIH